MISRSASFSSSVARSSFTIQTSTPAARHGHTHFAAELPPLPIAHTTWKRPSLEQTALLCFLGISQLDIHADETLRQHVVLPSPRVRTLLHTLAQEGWQRLGYYDTFEKGDIPLSATAFVNDKTRQVVIALQWGWFEDNFTKMKSVLNVIKNDQTKLLTILAELFDETGGLFAHLKEHHRPVGSMPSSYHLTLTGHGIGGWAALVAGVHYDKYRPSIITFDAPGYDSLSSPLDISKHDYTAYVKVPTMLNTLCGYPNLEVLRYVGTGKSFQHKLKPYGSPMEAMGDFLCTLVQKEEPLTTESVDEKEHRGHLYRMTRWPKVEWKELLGNNAFVQHVTGLFGLAAELSLSVALGATGGALIMLPQFASTCIALLRIRSRIKDVERISQSDILQPHSNSARAQELAFQYEIFPQQECEERHIPPAMMLMAEYVAEQLLSSSSALPTELEFFKERDFSCVTGTSTKHARVAAPYVIDDALDALGYLLFAWYQNTIPSVLQHDFEAWLKTSKAPYAATLLGVLEKARQRTSSGVAPAPVSHAGSASTITALAPAVILKEPFKAAAAGEWSWVYVLLGPTLLTSSTLIDTWRDMVPLKRKVEYLTPQIALLEEVYEQLLHGNVVDVDKAMTRLKTALSNRHVLAPPDLVPAVADLRGVLFAAALTRYQTLNSPAGTLTLPIRMLYPTHSYKATPETDALNLARATVTYQEYTEIQTKSIIKKTRDVLSELHVALSSIDPTVLRLAMEKLITALIAKEAELSTKTASLPKISSVDPEEKKRQELTLRQMALMKLRDDYAKADPGTEHLTEQKQLLEILVSLLKELQNVRFLRRETGLHLARLEKTNVQETAQVQQLFESNVQTWIVALLRTYKNKAKAAASSASSSVTATRTLASDETKNQPARTFVERAYQGTAFLTTTTDEPIPEKLEPILESVCKNGGTEPEQVQTVWIWLQQHASKADLHALEGGKTVLHLAAEQGAWDVVATLLAGGAELLLPDTAEKTALTHLREQLKSHFTKPTDAELLVECVREVPLPLHRAVQEAALVLKRQAARSLYPEQAWDAAHCRTRPQVIAFHLEKVLQQSIQSNIREGSREPLGAEQRLLRFLLQLLDYHWVLGCNEETLREVLFTLLPQQPDYFPSTTLWLLGVFNEAVAAWEKPGAAHEEKLGLRYTNLMLTMAKVAATEKAQLATELANTKKDLTTELQTKDTELQNTETKLQNTETELQDTKTELAQSRGNEATLQGQLADVKTQLEEKIRSVDVEKRKVEALQRKRDSESGEQPSALPQPPKKSWLPNMWQQ
ncbi:MAG: hypothetical protein ACHP9Y_00265 [Gammaproteobacteria bacterium]